MAGFNAEIALKALEKRVDRMETLLGSIEKQVKVLVDTRGASKEKAVDELVKLLPAMNAVDEKLKAEVSALTQQARKDRESFEKLSQLAQGAMDKEFTAARKVQEADLKRLEGELSVRQKDSTARMELLLRQQSEAAFKRETAAAKEYGALADKLAEQKAEQAKATMLAASLDARFTRLEALVQALNKR